MDWSLFLLALPLVAFVVAIRVFFWKHVVRPADPPSDAKPQVPEADKDEPRDSRRRDAAHEIAHAWIAWMSPYVQRVTEAHIGRFMGDGGLLRSRSSRHSPLMLWDDMVIKLAGIAAEATVFGSFFAREAENDLLGAKVAATELSEIERRDGLADHPPPWNPEEERHVLSDVKDFLPVPMTPRVREIMNHAYRRALFLVERDAALLERGRRELYERKRLRTEDFERLFGSRPLLLALSVPPDAPPPHP